MFAYTDFFLICLDIIERDKISEYNFVCPFLSQGFTFFLDLKKIINFFTCFFFIIFSYFFNSLNFCLHAFIFSTHLFLSIYLVPVVLKLN